MANNHIIIGIGGTGGNVIKIFRQQIVDKYGDIVDGIDVLKNIEFLYIDSKQSEFNDEEWEYQGKSIKLKGNSTLLMRAGILNEKLEDYSTRPSFLGKNEDWGDLRNDKDLAQKAGNQMRRLGRVNLIPNITKIVDRVKDMQKRLSENTSSKTLIHIVTGLAGGTGSGSVIDVIAQLIKAFEEGNIDVKINLYLKLPELSIPHGWGGVYAGVLQGVSFYQINGYAALKEINGLANGYFFPYDITTKKLRIKTDKLLQTAYIISEQNDAGVTFSDVIPSIASLLFLKTITIKAENTNALSLTKILEDDIDANENTTINPASWWQLSPKYPVPGIYKVGVPKVQIRESFAYLLVLNAFNKLLYKNYDEVGGKGYFGMSKSNLKEVDREKNQITTNLRSALLDEWFLTYNYLILDEPMVDINNRLLTEGRDDYSFKVAYTKEYNRQYTLLTSTKQFKGKFIKDNEILKYLQIAINDFFNKDYKGFGYERYYANMLNNLPQISDFISYRIKEKLFGIEGGKQSRTYPLDSYIDLLECIIGPYFDGLERDMKNKQQEYTKLVESKQAELKNINEEFINSFGLIINKPKKREKSIANFNDALEKFWLYSISLKGINYAFQLIHGQLKNKLLDLKKDIENDVKKIVNRRDNLNKEYVEEVQKLNDGKGVNGFKSITNIDGLKRFQTALMKDSNKFNEVMSRLENLIYEHKDKVFQSTDILKNKDLPIMKKAYSEIDDLLSEKNFKDLLKEEDQFYNAHVAEVLYNKYNKDANNPELRDLLVTINEMSAPLAKLNSSKKGSIEIKKATIIILPELQNIKQDSEIYKFYQDFKKVIISNFANVKLIEISNSEFKNEITVAQFYYRVLPDMIDNIEKLKTHYDKVRNTHEICFLMHTEDVSNLADLIPPKTPDDYKKALLPYLLILSTVDNSFKTYGDKNFWKITEVVNMKSTLNSNVASSMHDGDEIDIFLECNDIDTFLSLEFDRLDNKNSYRPEIQSFINPFIFTAFRKKSLGLLKDETVSVSVMNKLQKFLDECLVKAKNDSSDARYKFYKEAYQSVQRIINNL